MGTVDVYKKLSALEQGKAMTNIKTKISNMGKTMDLQFDEYVNDQIPNKIISLNKLSQTIPNLFVESKPIKVNIIKTSNKKNAKLPPRKRRKLNKNKMEIDEEENDSADEAIWFKKAIRTRSELSRL